MVTNALFTTLRGVGLHKTLCLKEFRGFTLAEVLITLVIIGVIAAMTIPTLINKTNKQEYVSRLKKAYSTLSQATNRIIADEGMPRGDIGGWATSTENIYNLYRKYLNKAKACDNGITGCFSGTYTRMNGVVNSLDTGVDRYGLILSDGIAFLFQNNDFSMDCSLKGCGTNEKCQHILVDVNGPKGPNIVGQDTFAFSLTADGLVPSGCDYNVCKPTEAGWGCTCKALREGAINY